MIRVCLEDVTRLGRFSLLATSGKEDFLRDQMHFVFVFRQGDCFDEIESVWFGLLRLFLWYWSIAFKTNW